MAIRRVGKKFIYRFLPCFLCIVFLLSISYIGSPKPAKAVAIVDDIIIGGAVIAWLSAAGIAIGSELASNDGTIESTIEGLKDLCAQYDSAHQQVAGYLWGQLIGGINDVAIFVDETLVKPIISIDNALTGAVSTGLNDFGDWLVSQFGLVSDMAQSVQMQSITSAFLVDGTSIVLGNTSSATRFYHNTVYNFIRGNSIEVQETVVASSGNVRSIKVYINNQLVRSSSLNNPSSSHFYTLNLASGNYYSLSIYSYKSDGITLDSSMVISTDNTNSQYYNTLYEEFSNPSTATLDGLGKDVLPGLDLTDYTDDDAIYLFPDQSLTGSLPSNPTLEDVARAYLDAAKGGDLVANPDNATSRVIAQEGTAPNPPSNDDNDDDDPVVGLPLIGIGAAALQIPNIVSGMASIWSYVIAWVSSLGAWFTWMFGVFGNLPYAIVVPIYASAVVVIVLGLYKRFFM